MWGSGTPSGVFRYNSPGSLHFYSVQVHRYQDSVTGYPSKIPVPLKTCRASSSVISEGGTMISDSIISLWSSVSPSLTIVPISSARLFLYAFSFPFCTYSTICVVYLIQVIKKAAFHQILTLADNSYDHFLPTSDLSLARSDSMLPCLADLGKLAFDIILPCGEINQASFLQQLVQGRERAFISSVLLSARSIDIPTSAISSLIPETDSLILTCASAAEYCAFMVSFLDRNTSIFVESRFSAATSFSCSVSRRGNLLVKTGNLGGEGIFPFEGEPGEVLPVCQDRFACLGFKFLAVLEQFCPLQLQPLLWRWQPPQHPA